MIDNYFLNLRKSNYIRETFFCNMVRKHALQKCMCSHKNKICDYTSNPFLQSIKDAYSSTRAEGDELVMKNMIFFETMYNTNQSITQSLRCKSGNNFEKCFEKILKMFNIPYSKQVCIDNDGNIDCGHGHKVDFMIPPPRSSLLSEYDGDIISLKTTMRERVLQDKYLGNFVLITLDGVKIKDDTICVIRIVENGKELHNYIIEKMNFK